MSMVLDKFFIHKWHDMAIKVIHAGFENMIAP